MNVVAIIVVIALLALAVFLILVALKRLRFGQDKNFSFDIGGSTPTASGGEDSSADANMATRLRIFGGVCVAGIAVLIARLFSMQVFQHDEYLERAETNRTRTITISAARGRILDRNGAELVSNRPSLTVTGTPEVLDDEFCVRTLANVLGMPAGAVRRKLQDTTAGAQAARTISIDAPRRVVAYLNEHGDCFANVTVEERSQRNYPLGSTAAHILGYTGTVLPEQLEASSKSQEQDAITYLPGDTVGQTGIEYQYENVLAGIRGEQTVYVNADGRVTTYSTSIEAEAGSDVVLTIDVGLQQATEDALEHAMDEARRQGYRSCYKGGVVVMDVTNGEILSLASAPTYNPNVFVGGISNDDWAMLSGEESGNPLLNRISSGQYPSASTIKPIVTFCALDNHIADDKSEFECTGYWTGFGAAFGQYCWERKGHGIMNLRNGIVYSCDTVFYEIGKALFYADDKELLQRKMREWGLGSRTGIDLPTESEGRVPDAEWKWNYFASYSELDRTWQGGDMSNLCIGQGYLLVTPLQMACIYMGLATKGTMWRPHLLKSVRSKRGAEDVVVYEPQELRHTDEPASNYALVDNALEGVIYEESEAMTSHFASLPVRIAGKTGTGEASNNKAPTGWFMAYAPAENPKYLVCAMVEEAGFGSTSAMYAVRDVLGYLYDSPDTSVQLDTNAAR